MGTPATGSTRLSVDDWLQVGFATIAEEGFRAVKIERLCERIGATRGSFYWHFSDIQAYRDALGEAWQRARAADRRRLRELAAVEPRERLSHMMDDLVSPEQWILERAMREWARTDAKVAAALKTFDREILRAVRQAFLDAGFEPRAAEIRGQAAFAVGVGSIHLSDRPPSARHAREREEFLDILMRPDVPA